MSAKPNIPDMTLHDYIAIMAMPVVAEHLKDEIENMLAAHNMTEEEEQTLDADYRMQAIALLAHDMATLMMDVREMRNARDNT